MPNPYVPLDRQPNGPDYLTTLGQVYDMRRQQRAEELTARQIQKADREAADEANIRQAIRPEKGLIGAPDVNPQERTAGMINRLEQLGTPQAMAMANQLRTSQQESERRGLGLQSDRLRQMQEQGEYIAGHLYGILSAPPEQKQTVYAASRKALIDRQMLQPGGPDDPGEIYPGDEVIRRLHLETLRPLQQLQQQRADEVFEYRRQNDASKANALQEWRDTVAGLRGRGLNLRQREDEFRYRWRGLQPRRQPTLDGSRVK